MKRKGPELSSKQPPKKLAVTSTLYLALIRGINVSGQKIIKMDSLRTNLSVHFKNIKTFIQTGNLLFHSELDRETVTKTIHDTILTNYGFSVEIILRSHEEWKNLCDVNPYKDLESKKVHLVFLSSSPETQLIEGVSPATEPEKFTWSENKKQIFIYTPNGYSRSPLANNHWEKKLKIQASTRNLNTVQKLLSLANGLQTDFEKE